MFLFILESIGTSELLLIAVVALIFLGPRKMPEMARKIGKIMSEFRNTTSEFKETWQREVKFEDEEKSFLSGGFLDDAVSRAEPPANPEIPSTVTTPSIRQIDPATIDLSGSDVTVTDTAVDETIKAAENAPPNADAGLADKRSWL